MRILTVLLETQVLSSPFHDCLGNFLKIHFLLELYYVLGLVVFINLHQSGPMDRNIDMNV